MSDEFEQNLPEVYYRTFRITGEGDVVLQPPEWMMSMAENSLVLPPDTTNQLLTGFENIFRRSHELDVLGSKSYVATGQIPLIDGVSHRVQMLPVDAVAHAIDDGVCVTCTSDNRRDGVTMIAHYSFLNMFHPLVLQAERMFDELLDRQEYAWFVARSAADEVTHDGNWRMAYTFFGDLYNTQARHDPVIGIQVGKDFRDIGVPFASVMPADGLSGVFGRMKSGFAGWEPVDASSLFDLTANEHSRSQIINHDGE